MVNSAIAHRQTDLGQIAVGQGKVSTATVSNLGSVDQPDKCNRQQGIDQGQYYYCRST